jgi:hypothetical protein
MPAKRRCESGDDSSSSSTSPSEASSDEESGLEVPDDEKGSTESLSGREAVRARQVEAQLISGGHDPDPAVDVSDGEDEHNEVPEVLEVLPNGARKSSGQRALRTYDPEDMGVCCAKNCLLEMPDELRRGIFDGFNSLQEQERRALIYVLLMS